ncbi:MAG: winged helix DNA-binding domain-containing protein [Bacillota bacterium]
MEVTLQQANRYLLKRQHLLSPCDDPLRAVRDACGLQAQIPSTPALSLRARVRGFDRADYEAMLVKERSLVRTWAMRGTVHTVPAAQLARYTRIYTEGQELGAWPEKALALLAAGPATRDQLSRRAVTELGIAPDKAKELFGPWGGILRTLARHGLTVHMPMEGADVPVVLTEQWLGCAPGPAAREELEDALLQDYLNGYGPASMQDFAYFLTWPLSRVRPLFARAEGLVEIRLEGSKLPYFVPEARLSELAATTGQEPAPIQVLPRFDSILLAHRDKERLIDPAYRTQVFRPAAVVEATVLLDGRVAGTWRMKRTTRELQVVYQPFRKGRGRGAPRAVEAEFKRLAGWYGLDKLSLEVV